MPQQQTDKSKNFEEISKEIDMAIGGSDLDSLKKIASEQKDDFKKYISFGECKEHMEARAITGNLSIMLININVLSKNNAPEILKLFIENGLNIDHAKIGNGICQLLGNHGTYNNLEQATRFLETILDCKEMKQFDIETPIVVNDFVREFQNKFMCFMEEALREDNELNLSENPAFVDFLKALSVLSISNSNIADILCTTLIYSQNFTEDPAKDVLDFLLQSEIYPRGNFFNEQDIMPRENGIYSTVKYLHEKNVDFFAQRGNKEFDTIFFRTHFFNHKSFTTKLTELFEEISKTGESNNPLPDSLDKSSTEILGEGSIDLDNY